MQKKNTILNFGNSGTLARLLIGILSTTPNIRVRVMGDESLNKRNMSRLIKVMNRFGAEFLPKNKYNFPLTLVSSEMPIGIDYISGDSAQIKSSVILAGLNSYGNSEIIEKKETRDHTEANRGTGKTLEEKQKPIAEHSDNPRRASNDPREVKKMQRQKELGIKD